MSTEKQINANRQNAQKSTGPKTDEGKAAVSQNAVKHGIFSQSVIKGESEAAYEAFHNKMLDEMKPVGSTEILLAARIVCLWWRLERVERIQNQAIDVMIERDEPSPFTKNMQRFIPKNIGPDLRGAGPELILGRAVIKDYSDSRVLDRLMLYEKRIESSLHKAMRELERQQIIRQCQQQENEQRFDNITVEKNSDLKKQNQSQSLAGNTKSEYLNPKRVKEDTVLKKQSQFVPGQNDTTSCKKGDYDKILPRGAQENKANQVCPECSRIGQFDALARPEGIEKNEKSVTAVAG